MEFLKKLGKAFFGSSRSPQPKKAKSKRPKIKTKLKKAVASNKVKAAKKKKAVPKSVKKSVSKSIKTRNASVQSKKQTSMVKEALAILPIAEVTHYFPKVNVAVLKIKEGTIRIGNKLHFKGHTTDFMQKAVSMQIDHQPITLARKGDDLGLQVKGRVRAGDLVYKK